MLLNRFFQFNLIKFRFPNLLSPKTGFVACALIETFVAQGKPSILYNVSRSQPGLVQKWSFENDELHIGSILSMCKGAKIWSIFGGLKFAEKPCKSACKKSVASRQFRKQVSKVRKLQKNRIGSSSGNNSESCESSYR